MYNQSEVQGRKQHKQNRMICQKSL
uniref:Uncharacterized protein n=1 Tax=Arundo donax TaxID=35708 RepID=A0A0A9BBH9_ARUDO